MYQGTNQPPLGTPINKSHPLAQGLVGCWIFTEGGGQKSFDSMGLNPVGTLTNGAIFKVGQRGQCVSLDGVNDYVNVGTNSPLTSLTGAITIISWAKPTDFLNFNSIIGKTGNGGTATNIAAPFDCYLKQTSGVLTLVRGNGTGTTLGTNYRDVAATSAPTVNVWTHLAVTQPAPANNSTVNFYYNGVLISSPPLSFSQSCADGGNNALIGSRTDGATKFKGLINGVWIYNRALSQTEIRQHYINSYQMFQQTRPLKLAV